MDGQPFNGQLRLIRGTTTYVIHSCPSAPISGHTSHKAVVHYDGGDDDDYDSTVDTR